MSCPSGIKITSIKTPIFEDIQSEELIVTGNLQVSGNIIGLYNSPSFLSGNIYEVKTLDSSIIIPIQGSTVSLTLPLANNVIGKEITIKSESNFVESTSNDIIRLYNFNPTNQIMGNLDSFAILKSDGSNWIRIV